MKQSRSSGVSMNCFVTLDGKFLSCQESAFPVMPPLEFFTSDSEKNFQEIAHFNSLLVLDKIEEIFLTIYPVILGGKQYPSLTGVPGGFLREEKWFRLNSFDESEEGIRVHYRRDRGNKEFSFAV